MASLTVWSDGDGGQRRRVGGEGYRGGVFAGLEEEGRSSARLRLGSSLGASTDHGESFASVNLAGVAL